MAHLGFRSPSPIPGAVGPSYAPSNLPHELSGGVSTGAGAGPFKVRQIIGVNIAFGSPALTDAPLWIRLDEPGSI